MTTDNKNVSPQCKNKDKYEVGYKKPPRAHQFVKGQSGNPKGRPKGSKNLMTLIFEELEEKIVVQEQGEQKTITKSAAIAKQVVNKAMRGDPRSTELICKMTGMAQKSEPSESDDVTVDTQILDNFKKRISQKE